MNFSERKINAAKSGDMRLYSKTNLLLSQNLPLSHKYIKVSISDHSDKKLILKIDCVFDIFLQRADFLEKFFSNLEAKDSLL